MNILASTTDAAARWTESVARTILGARERFTSSRVVRLVEQDDGSVTIEAAEAASAPQAAVARIHVADARVAEALTPELAARIKGSRAELVLQPKHFLFRPLELPRRAGEFLDGIVRSQIDRLTPWNMQDAVFGYTHPIEIANDRIALTVAATARAVVAPYLEAIAGLGVQSVCVLAPGDDMDPASPPIKVAEQSTRGGGDLPRLQHALLAALLIAVAITAVVAGTATIYAQNLQSEHDDVSRRIAEQRAAMHAGREAPTGAAVAQHALEQRKQEAPSIVIVIEALSRVLPDYAYLTELRVEGDKLQIVGVTRDAPSLIPLLEQSSHFTHATFFAPTTRSQNDPGERFHIEAKIRPVFAPGT